VAAGNRNASRREVNVPVEGFSDIAFLLIIFFILTTTLQQTTGFLSDMPSSEESEEKTEEETPKVQLKDQAILYGEETLEDMEALREKLAELKLAEREEEDRVVLLEASGSVNYQLYYESMAAISKAGGMVGIIREAEGDEE